MALNPSRKMFTWEEETSNRLFTYHRLKCFGRGAARRPVPVCLPQLFCRQVTGTGVTRGRYPSLPSDLWGWGLREAVPQIPDWKQERVCDIGLVPPTFVNHLWMNPIGEDHGGSHASARGFYIFRLESGNFENIFLSPAPHRQLNFNKDGLQPSAKEFHKEESAHPVLVH